MNNNYKYAKTFFDICKKTDKVSVIHNQLKSIEYLYNKVPAFRLVLITKRLTSEDKINIISKSLHSFDAMIMEFLSFIINNNHINQLLNIILRFKKMVKSSDQINNIEITTANKLNDEDLESIKNTLGQKLRNVSQINTLIDTDIIGGIKLRIGNNIFDNSISYQINKLKKTLHNM